VLSATVANRIARGARRQRGIRVMCVRGPRQSVMGGLWAIFLLTTLTSGVCAAETPVKFSLNFKIEGTSAPFLLPLDKGYYKAEHLNVTVDPATGTADAIKRVASGNYDLGFADINALIKFRDANPKAPLKAIFMVYNRPPFAVIGRRSRGIEVPRDLEGKKLGAPATDGSFAEWPIFANVNHIDASKVTIETIAAPVREPMLAAGQVDAVTGVSFSTYVDLKDKGVPVNDIAVLLMADYGLKLYGNAIVVNTTFAAEHPDAVKGFLSAFLKGLKETVKSPAAAIGTVLDRTDGAKKDVEIERLSIAIRDNIVTPEVKANGYGGIDPTRFAAAIDQLATAYKFKNAKPGLDDIFDGSYLPPAAERKVASQPAVKRR
jgi:NitT/TauT family transport system substrate-binding protein